MRKNILVVIVALLSVLYLLNPTAGVLELIPDNIPGIGNLDEATAVFLLISCFRYFGFDMANLFKNRKK
ncbi:hypothetical protein MNBD_GAMMA18-563 [hydrothermal vent metagenome]|uniref:Uncharacterized protein n=1 Tax=hydrothermal vent metagenome TaxID=652676 RepID=A0A3B0ZF06_9ZZZZ